MAVIVGEDFAVIPGFSGRKRGKTFQANNRLRLEIYHQPDRWLGRMELDYLELENGLPVPVNR